MSYSRTLRRQQRLRHLKGYVRKPDDVRGPWHLPAEAVIERLRSNRRNKFSLSQKEQEYLDRYEAAWGQTL